MDYSRIPNNSRKINNTLEFQVIKEDGSLRWTSDIPFDISTFEPGYYNLKPANLSREHNRYYIQIVTFIDLFEHLMKKPYKREDPLIYLTPEEHLTFINKFRILIAIKKLDPNLIILAEELKILVSELSALRLTRLSG